MPVVSHLADGRTLGSQTGESGGGLTVPRVLHLNAGNLYGGVETFLRVVAESRPLAPDFDHEFALCFPGRHYDDLLATGAAVHMLGAVRTSRPWTVFRARRQLRNLLRSCRYHAVVSHGPWPHALFSPVVRNEGARSVFWAHNELRKKHWLEWWAGSTPPDLVIANSRYTKSTVSTLFPGIPCIHVNCPVAPPPDFDRGSTRAMVRGEIGTDPDSVVIVLAARFEAWKGHELLIDALSHIAEVPNWECWIAGGAQRPYEARYLAVLQRTVTQNGLSRRVRFLGQRADIPRLLAAADLLCQPNTAPEPFGIAFIEALYAGLPIVSTDFGGAAEIVTPDCGILTPPNNAGAVSTALKQLITDGSLRCRLGNAGRVRANELCNPTTQMRATHSALTRLHEPACA